MKKLLLVTALTVGASAAFTSLPAQQIEASAKAYDMKSSFAKELKNGTMPYLKGKVGMTYSKLKKKERGFESPSDLFNFYQTPNQDLYGFEIKNAHSEKIVGNQKVQIISRMYDYKISESSVKKYFGKSYRGKGEDGKDVKANIYKAGKYYVYFVSSSEYTSISVGTKKAIQREAWIKGLYK